MPEACERCGTFAALRSNGFRDWCEACWGSSAQVLDRPITTFGAQVDALRILLRDFFLLGVALVLPLRALPNVVLILLGAHRPWLGILIDVFLGTLGEALLLSVVFERSLRGQSSTDWPTVWRRVRRRFLFLATANVLTNLVVTLGVFLCLIPGMFAATFLCAVVPLVLYEELGPFRAFAESVRRVRPQVWRLLGLMSPLLILAWGISFATTPLANALGHGDANTEVAVKIGGRLVSTLLHVPTILIQAVVWGATRPEVTPKEITHDLAGAGAVARG